MGTAARDLQTKWSIRVGRFESQIPSGVRVHCAGDTVTAQHLDEGLGKSRTVAVEHCPHSTPFELKTSDRQPPFGGGVHGRDERVAGTAPVWQQDSRYGCESCPRSIPNTARHRDTTRPGPEATSSCDHSATAQPPAPSHIDGRRGHADLCGFDLDGRSTFGRVIRCVQRRSATTLGARSPGSYHRSR
jgi:hypothetical protein